MTGQASTAIFNSSIIPVQLNLDDKIQFHCHPGIACFNKCCENIDIALNPYDVLRLKNRLKLSSRQFLANFTVPYEMDSHGMPGIKMRTQPGSTACQFLTAQGCGVYADRPAACRYYALGMLAMRKKDSATDENSYFLVKEDHCLGHYEPKTQTVAEYRREQGVDIDDELNREWYQIVLKKRSSGPTVGKPTERSLDLFFIGSYDLDGFREFVRSSSFQEIYAIDADDLQRLMNDEIELMTFGFRFLKQSLFGENTIPVNAHALEKRLARKRQAAE